MGLERPRPASVSSVLHTRPCARVCVCVCVEGIHAYAQAVCIGGMCRVPRYLAFLLLNTGLVSGSHHFVLLRTAQKTKFMCTLCA